jgi:glutaredoxin
VAVNGPVVEGGSVAGPGRARVTLIGRADCHLCDAAREVIRLVLQGTSIGWVEVDVDTDTELLRRYSEQVPVTLVDGAQHDFWRVDETRLRQALGLPQA